MPYNPAIFGKFLQFFAFQKNKVIYKLRWIPVWPQICILRCCKLI